MSQHLDGAGAGTPAPSHRSGGGGTPTAARRSGPGPAWHRPVTLPAQGSGAARVGPTDGTGTGPGGDPTGSGPSGDLTGSGPTRKRHRRPGRLALLGGIVLSLGLAGIAAAWVQAPGLDGQTEIRIHFSRFAPTEVVATAGVPLTIVLVNTDPIDHEWLAGDDAFHERHRTGTEQQHGVRPTEISLPAGETVTTTVTFQQPGEYRFICHLPGHEAYGMVGILRVVPAS